MILSLCAFLLLPLGTSIAAPSPPGGLGTAPGTVKLSRSDDCEWAPFAPDPSGQGVYEICGDHTIDSSSSGGQDDSHPAKSWIDCLELEYWANSNPGMWVVKTTTSSSEDDWTVLRAAGDCALAVRNPYPTNIGNQDVEKLISEAFRRDGEHIAGNAEARGSLTCTGNVTMAWWLRSPEGL